MKQLLIIAIALTSVNAFASRARLLSLGSSPHLVDTQSVYAKPYDMFNLASDYVALETGTNAGITPATAQNTNPEGMIVRTMGDAKMGLSLGHQSQNASGWPATATTAPGLRSFAVGVGSVLEVNQQNPIEFTYGKKAGEMTWAGTFVYSNYNNKKAATTVGLEKESSMGVRLGANQGPWDGTLSLGLTNTANIMDGNKFTGTLGIGLNGGYKMDTMYFFGNVVQAGAKEESVAGTEVMKVSTQTITLGVVNSHKKDGNELFYSVALNQASSAVTVGTETKTTIMMLPITIGLEVDAASWVTLRGSVSQSTLINDQKVETAGTTTTELAPNVNTTNVAMGAGLKFNKMTVDGTIMTTSASTAGNKLDTTQLLAQVGATYWF